MKTMKMKTILLLALVAALLLGTVGGTVAYLVTSAEPVTNTFMPGVVDVEIDDDVVNSTKSNIVVTNNSTVAVYLRVAVVGYWVNEAGQIIDSWTGSLSPDSDWSADGKYYYYGAIVQPETKTIDFMRDSSYTQPSREDGAHLEMDIMVQAIQAEGLPVGVTTAQLAFDQAAQ